MNRIVTLFWRFAYYGSPSLISQVEQSLHQIPILVRCFYAAMFYVAMLHLQRWGLYLTLEPYSPLWPVRWMAAFSWSTSLMLVLGLFVGGAGLALAFPDRRWARVIAFLGCFEFYALFNSMRAAVSHNDHVFILAAFMLILLTRSVGPESSPAAKKNYAFSFFGVQAVIFLIYSMSGVTKVLLALKLGLAGQMTVFSEGALANQIARSQLQQGTDSILGGWVLRSWIFNDTWLPTLLFTAVIILECLGLYVMFRPDLHRWYGLLMISFHLGVATLMGLFFSTQILTVGIFLVASPFAPARFSLKDTFRLKRSEKTGGDSKGVVNSGEDK